MSVPPPAASTRFSMWGTVRSLLPRWADYPGLSRSWRTDVVAGLTVGVVALPLALASDNWRSSTSPPAWFTTPDSSGLRISRSHAWADAFIEALARIRALPAFA